MPQLYKIINMRTNVYIKTGIHKDHTAICTAISRSTLNGRLMATVEFSSIRNVKGFAKKDRVFLNRIKWLEALDPNIAFWLRREDELLNGSR